MVFKSFCRYLKPYNDLIRFFSAKICWFSILQVYKFSVPIISILNLWIHSMRSCDLQATVIWLLLSLFIIIWFIFSFFFITLLLWLKFPELYWTVKEKVSILFWFWILVEGSLDIYPEIWCWPGSVMFSWLCWGMFLLYPICLLWKYVTPY